MIAAGFAVLSVAVLVWTYRSIPRAAMACGDAPLAALALRRRFLAAAVAWVAIAMALAWIGVLKRWDVRPPPLMGLLVCILALGPIPRLPDGMVDPSPPTPLMRPTSGVEGRAARAGRRGASRRRWRSSRCSTSSPRSSG